MADLFKQHKTKDYWNGVSCGDGWNSDNYGHTKRRTKGRKKLNRKARKRLKAQLRKELEY